MLFYKKVLKNNAERVKKINNRMGSSNAFETGAKKRNLIFSPFFFLFSDKTLKCPAKIILPRVPK